MAVAVVVAVLLLPEKFLERVRILFCFTLSSSFRQLMRVTPDADWAISASVKDASNTNITVTESKQINLAGKAVLVESGAKVNSS